MRRIVVNVLLAGMVLGSFSSTLLAQTKPQPAPMKLKIGDTAPDFTLLAYDGQGMKPVSLHDFKGKKNVALAFYVFAFTGG